MCLLVSSVSNFCPGTRGRWWSLIWAHLFSHAEGREEHCKQISLACVGSGHSVLATLSLPLSQHVCFRSLHCWGSRLLCQKLSEMGLGLHALPRSKPFRFSFSGTPQRHRLGWACILCPSHVQEAQLTKCLASALSPGGAVHLITSPIPATRFPGCAARELSQVCCVSPLGSWYLAETLLVDINHPGSQEDLVSNWGSAHSLVEDAMSGAELAPLPPALAISRLPLCL